MSESTTHILPFNPEAFKAITDVLQKRDVASANAHGARNPLQLLCLIAGVGVAQAYSLYPCGTPTGADYKDYQVIQVSESADQRYRSKLAPPNTALQTDRAAAGCSGDYVTFGFTATSIDNAFNILALRGTSDSEEAGYDIYDWDSYATCTLPTQQSPSQNYGNVKWSLWDFYSDGDGNTSLAQSCMAAIQQTASSYPDLPWIVCAHSLGGAMATFAAMDATLSNYFGSQPVVVVTFGSLHVGDQTFATNYNEQCGGTLRVANLADFVPSLVGIEPGNDTYPYVHVGIETTFVWQTWSDWQNHSLTGIYIPTVASHWDVIKFGPRQYPQ